MAVAFFGDGATNQGQFHEALNLAAIWKLPAVFVAENNGYGEATPMEFVTPVRDLAVRAGAYAMASAIADGMDFFDVHEKAGAAVARARAGEGPTLLECKTYRYYGHYVGDPLTYRTKEEAEAWRQRDALAHFAERTVREGLVEPGNLHRIDTEVAAEVDDAVRAAQEAPLPPPDDVATDVYVNG